MAEGDRRFNVRAVAVVRHGQEVLVQRCAGDAFLALPGGRVEWGETFQETVAREMMEELEERVEVGRVLWVVENFFELGGARFHELDAYVEATLPAGSPLLRARGPHASREAPGVSVEWVEAARLRELDLPLLPSFLAERLARPLPASVEHVVVR